MHEDLSARINDLLDRIEHAAVATVSADGQPWNTPVYFAKHGDSFYWTSRRDAQHSTNIRHNKRALLVVFDSSREDASGAAAYVEANVVELADDGDIQAGLEVIYRRRDKPVPRVAQFSSSSVHAIYRAQALRMWSNVLHTSGEVPWDERVEVVMTRTWKD
jgi:nitroimidazol reductase NimA-like FMN-containing flavoprotein (pyridoxamine 5'-phosphate oxidase superfamily)